MKTRILAALACVMLLGATSCAYKTCPTYAKKASPAAKTVRA